jgi:hypothetical protein
MIREGAPVRVVARETSPPAIKYAGHTGHVTTTSPSLYATIFFVQLDEAPDGVHTAFDEQDLVEREGYGDHDGSGRTDYDGTLATTGHGRVESYVAPKVKVCNQGA